MLSHWLSSWYTTQQPQSQEPFNDQYEATEGEWVQVLTSNKRQQQSNVGTNELSPATNDESSQVTVTKQEKSVMKSEEEPVVITSKPKEKKKKLEDIAKPEVTEKGLSRQEKRAMARMAEREKKKQARNAAVLLSRRGKNISTNCLPSSPLIIE